MQKKAQGLCLAAPETVWVGAAGEGDQRLDGLEAGSAKPDLGKMFKAPSEPQLVSPLSHLH